MVPGPCVQVILAVLDRALKIGELLHRLLERGLVFPDLRVSLAGLDLQFPHAGVELDPVRVEVADAIEGDRPAEVGLWRDRDLDATLPCLLDEIDAAGLLVVIFLGGSHIDAPEADLVLLDEDGVAILDDPRRLALDRVDGEGGHPRQRRCEEVGAELGHHLLGGIRNRGREHIVVRRHVNRARLLLHPLDIFGEERRIVRAVLVELEERIQTRDDLRRPRRAAPDCPGLVVVGRQQGRGRRTPDKRNPHESVAALLVMTW